MRKNNNIAKVYAQNRRRNKTTMKNLAIAGTVANEIMKANTPITTKKAFEEIGGVSKSQFAWALKRGEERKFFTRVYNKKTRCFEYTLNNKKF